MATYALSVNKTEVIEGEAIVVTLTTTGVATGTKVYWEMIGKEIDPYDFLPRTLRGRFIVGSNGKATYSFQTDRDWKAEGIEYVTFKLRRFPTVFKTVKILDTSIPKINADLSVNKKTITGADTLEFKLQTSGVKTGTSFPWIIEGLTNSKISPATVSGSFKTDATGFATYKINVTKLINNEYLLLKIPSLNLSQKVTFNAPVVYTLTANKASVAEGEDVIFSLTVTNVQQGAKIPWRISGVKSSDIVGSNLTGSFTIDASGKATKTISIAITNLTDFRTLKLSLDTDPSISASVGIQAQQTIIISKDTSYINLLSLFKSIYGEPSSNTRALFIINEGVKVVSNSNRPTIESGTWPANSKREIRVMPNAIVAGKGGKGGKCSLIATANTSVTYTLPTAGEDGGTAIKAESNSPIVVINNGLIGGGGGGGGGQGGYQYFKSGSWNTSIWWMGSGGGAPYGEEFLNGNTWNHMVKHYGMPEQDINAIGGTYFEWLDNGNININGNYIGNVTRPFGLSGKLMGRVLGEVDSNGFAYMGRRGAYWPFNRKQIRLAMPGGLLVGGQGGSCAVTETMSVPHFIDNASTQTKADQLMNTYTGAKGGDIGKNGQDAPSLLPVIRTSGYEGNYANMSAGDQSSYLVARVQGAAGGLAGYIYEGPVTITNKDNGKSIGRTPQ